LRPFVGESKGQLIFPIGLEKDCSWNLAALETAYDGKNTREGFVPKLWVHKDALIYTENADNPIGCNVARVVADK